MQINQIQIPKDLSQKQINSIAYVFTHMSLAAQQSFLVSLIMLHPEHYERVVLTLGKYYTNAMVHA